MSDLKLNFYSVVDSPLDYLYLYDKTEDFNAKKSSNAVSSSSLERNVY